LFDEKNLEVVDRAPAALPCELRNRSKENLFYHE